MNVHVITAIAAVAAGAVASISGFGIGSILTPLLAMWLGTKLAVAVVSVPHFLGTALRFWLIREHIDRPILLSFGITSAIGGLVGALLHAWMGSSFLGYVLAALLVFAGIMGLTGAAKRLRFGHKAAWVAGALSGVFGGLVGNQGGIRSAALLGFDIRRDAFVATATAIALLVDVFRMPVYAVTQWRPILSAWPIMLTATLAVIAGTLLGQRVLGWIPERTFRLLVASIVLVLGLAMFLHPGA
jgi:uncharacterized membrane protein YfcA